MECTYVCGIHYKRILQDVKKNENIQYELADFDSMVHLQLTIFYQETLILLIQDCLSIKLLTKLKYI